LVQQIKRIYIEEARRWIEGNDNHGRVTKSKLAMLSGLDTRTISAIEAQPSDPSQCTMQDLCPEASILGEWSSRKDCADEHGAPKVLPILGKGVSFQALVSSSVGRNVTYQTALEQLLESGNVEVVNQNFVRLIDPFYQPIRTSEGTIVDAGSWAIGRLTETICNNLYADNEHKMLQQDRWSRKIPAESYPELRAEARVLASKQIAEMEQLIERFEVEDAGADHKTFGIGWFSFSN
ncbi:MAG: DUF6502 family protein, partial [Wenzhouxiangellaceae bacterium]